MTRLLTTSFLALGLGFGAAQAQVVGDIDVIANFMTDYGLPVEKTKDSDGDPKIESRIEGTNFSVYFYGCDVGQPCNSMQFSAGFNLNDPLSMDTVNDWNRGKRFGKVYIDEDGDPFIEYDINLDFDGVGAKNFDDTIDLWRVILGQFRDHIDW